MARTLAVLVGVALVVAVSDLAYTAGAVADRGGIVLAHDRSALYVAGVAAGSLLWAAAVALTRSSAIAVASGVILGGAMGNLASIALWPSVPGVPDPMVAGGVAFNLADVAVGLGFVLLLPATAVFAARNRERLFEPV